MLSADSLFGLGNAKCVRIHGNQACQHIDILSVTVALILTLPFL